MIELLKSNKICAYVLVLKTIILNRHSKLKLEAPSTLYYNFQLAYLLSVREEELERFLLAVTLVLDCNSTVIVVVVLGLDAWRGQRYNSGCGQPLVTAKIFPG